MLENIREQKDKWQNTLIVAVLLCLACSAVVSLAAVGLRPIIAKNKQLKLQRNVLKAAGRWEDSYTEKDIAQQFESIERVLINLPQESEDAPEAGTVNSTLGEGYDPRKAANDPNLAVEVGPELDIAKIRRREPVAPVYLVKDESGKVEQYIFPIYGKGLWSTLYGFIALQSDLETVGGITFYQHGETPGLGGEVDNQKWKNQWEGKIAFDDRNQPVIDVVKGTVTDGTPQAEHKIDGLSGATITSVGVENLVNYWLGNHAFGPYIDKQRIND